MYGITYKNILYLMPAWWACIARSMGTYRPLDGHLPTNQLFHGFRTKPRISKPHAANDISDPYLC